MEKWKSIPGFDGYKVSNMGRVRSYKKRCSLGWIICDEPQRVLKQNFTGSGYYYVNLCQNGKVSPMKVAYLVMLAFIGERPPTLEICHKDGNKTNNHLCNLRYDTHMANMQDGVEQYRFGRFNETEILHIRKQVAAKESTVKDLANKMGVSKQAITQICKGETYAHAPGPIIKKIPRQHKRRLKQKQTSKYRGVFRHNGYYVASIWTGGRGGRPLRLGNFDSETEAARAYDKKAKEMHGAFATLNFPDE